MSDHESMPCDEVEALLPLVADGAITCDDDPQLFTHLAVCPDCQRSLAAHDLVDLALAAGPIPPPTRVRVVPWPVAIGGGLLAAAAVVAAVWIGMADEAPTVVEQPQPTVQIIDVIQDGKGRSVYVVEKDGQRMLLHDLDRSSAVLERIDAMPVVAPHR